MMTPCLTRMNSDKNRKAYAFRFDFYVQRVYSFAGGMKMLKGVTRQVIVVRSPEGKLFEQAIFLLRDDSLSHGVGEQELLDEARRVAALYGA